MSNTPAKRKDTLLDAINKCKSISQLFELVRSENIDIRMQTLCSASSIPPKDTASADSEDNPLEKLKEAVALAVKSS